MKLTKIESYEIQAFAFRVMTGYEAPGKDVSPLAYEAPYEERCAAWDEWRNEHAPCILAMLHGFEALIDRDDEPPRALLDRLKAAEAEAQRLRESLRGLLAVTSSRAPGAGLIAGAEERHAAAIKQARAALENTDER